MQPAGAMGTTAVAPATSAATGRDRALQHWASSRGRIGAEVVGRLIAASGDVKSVLTEAQGKEILNKSLVLYLKEARHAASRAADLLGELDYYRIQEMEEDDGKEKKLTYANDGVSQVTEDTTEISAFSTEDSPSAPLLVVPYVAKPMIPVSARNTIPEPRLGITREITDLAEQCCTMARDLRKALVLEHLDDRIRVAQKQQSTWTDRRETSSCPTEPKVYGRDHERDVIINKLKGEGSSGRNLSVHAIVGNGGVGKTTLAKAVFNDPTVSEDFDILLWVYVSVYFDQAKIIHEMLESLLGDKHENIKGLKELQDILELALKSKRVLLVLDDMWEDGDTEKEKWDELLTPLLVNDVQRNKILVTTRKPSVAKFIGDTDYIDLGGLEPAEFWHFFKECAFGDANYRRQRLEKIGRKIVEQLKGNPLAAKSVGRVLRKRLDVGYWTRVLDNSEWKHQKDENDIMPALMISYIYLPVHLQPCFSYCAVFPKYHRYEKERLVNIWIAQGLICCTDMHRRLEDIGSEFFDDLVEWGFLQKEFELGRFLTMHDLIHDLAQNVSSDESFSIENNEPRAAPRLVRHVSIITEWEYKAQLDGTVRRNEPFLQVFSNSLVELQQNNKLSTLMLFGPHDLDFANTFRKEFSEVKYVRVLKLDMVVHDLDSMVGNISAFINLHYLELDCFYKLTRLELPEAVCRLYHLQVLDIKDWGASTDLPRGMNKLVNLRHFIAMEALHAKLAGIEKMVSLQELKAFAVRKESEFSLPQLRRLNQLRGSIWIHNLDNVGSQEEAIEARICDKVHLTTLRLSWNGMLGGKVGASSNKKIPILEDLKPHAGLVNLRIEAYGLGSPSWLSDNVHVTSLRSLHLNNCFKWRTIPQPQQLPLLRELRLINMLRVSKITIGSLEILELRNLQSLRQCIVLDKEQLSASLRVLQVEECIRLEEFPLRLFISTDMQSECQFTRLDKFQAHRNQIDSCFGHTNIPQLFLIDSLTNIHLSLEPNSEEFLLEPFGSSNGLRMEIKGNGKVLRKEGNLFSFNKLRDLVELEISEYPNLTCFAWEGFEQLPSLKKLRMSRCWKLFHPNIELSLPPSIQELEFSSCNITGKQLSQLLLNLRSLKNLSLTNCDEVTSLPVGMFTDEENQMAAGSWHIPPNCVTTLQSLQISFTRGFGDTSSRMHFFSEKGLGRFMSLKKIVIGDCPALLSTMMSGGACHIAPSCLVKLHVTSITEHLSSRLDDADCYRRLKVCSHARDCGI